MKNINNDENKEPNQKSDVVVQLETQLKKRKID